MNAKGPAVAGAHVYQPEMTAAERRDAIHSVIGQRIRMADYRPSVQALTPAERETIISQAQTLLEETYVHLALKRAMHATEPIQRLRLLKLRHARMTEHEFQCEMIDIFTDLRDLHTNYVLPAQYSSKYAFLPFRIEEFYESPHVRAYLVSWVSPICTDPNLKEGVVVTHWNGSPIEMGVARNAEREAGSNADARRARGIEALTLRWLGMSLPPDEDWVDLTYRDGATTRESRFDWEIVDRPDLQTLLTASGNGTGGGIAGSWGIDLKTELLQRVRKALFDPEAIRVESESSELRMRARGRAGIAAAPPRAEVSAFPDVFPRFGTVTTPHGAFGYIRLRTFAPPQNDLNGVVKEFARLLGSMPPQGLILDVRGNGGGTIWFGELILQMLTPREIAPEPFHFMATPLTNRLANSADWLSEWAGPIGIAIETGSTFSQGFPLTSPADCNAMGQIYQGPVVLVIDALCYSTTDIFAAGFQDHEIGRVVGVHGHTGAGGANVWTHEYLRTFQLAGGNPFQPLPGGASMRAAVRRSTRVGKRSGVPLEDLGVEPDIAYEMTRTDVLGNNEDLIAFCARVLSEMDRQALGISARAASHEVEVSSEGIDRVDIFVDRRPAVSRDLANGKATIAVPMDIAGRDVTAAGYRAGKLVVRARASASAP